MRLAGLRIGVVLGGVLLANAAHAEAPTVTQCLDASEQGEALRDEGKLLRARELFSTCAAASCPAPVRASCTSWLEATVERIPTVVLVVRDEDDVDLTDATVVIDGTAKTAVSGRPVELDPGPHTLDVEAPGRAPVRHTFVASVGDKNRLVRIRVPRTEGAAPPASSSHRPSRPRFEEERPLLPPVAIGLGLGAVTLLGASLGVGLLARDELGDLRDSPCGATRTCDPSATDDLRTRFVVADVLLGASVVLAGAAVWVWLSDSGDQGGKHSRFQTRRPFAVTW